MKIQTLLVNGPRFVRLHVDAVVDFGDHLIEIGIARLQRQIAVANNRNMRPAFGAGVAGGTRSPQTSCDLPRCLIADEHAVLHDVPALGANAVVIEAKGREPSGNCAVAIEINPVRTVSEFAFLFESDETCPREIGFHAEHAVKLGGMADRLMNLKSDL